MRITNTDGKLRMTIRTVLVRIQVFELVSIQEIAFIRKFDLTLTSSNREIGLR